LNRELLDHSRSSIINYTPSPRYKGRPFQQAYNRHSYIFLVKNSLT